MTRVIVNAGICGSCTTVEVRRIAKHRVSVVLSSDCEMVESMNGQLQDLEWLEVLGPPTDSAVWDCACEHLKHPSCPVPTAILKAIEVELELALPKDVVIHFDDPESR